MNVNVCIYLYALDGGYIEENGVHYIVPPAPLMCKSGSSGGGSGSSGGSSGGGGGGGEVAFGYIEFFSDGSGMALKWYGNKPSAAAYPSWPMNGVKLPFINPD